MISSLDSPDRHSPAYNPIYWLLDSTNKNKAGFSYVVDIYTGTSFDAVARLKVPKRPVTGYGLLDVSSVVRPFIDHERDIITGGTNYLAAPNYYLRYSLQFGESYEYFTFVDSYYGPSGRVLFSSITDLHDFEVGDLVIVQQDAPFLYPEFNGLHTVMDVVDAHSFTIDEGFQSGPVTPGRVWRNDSSQITFTGMTSAVTTTVGYGFAREEFTDFSSDQYLPSFFTPPVSLITNCPNGFRMRADSQAWIPIPNNTYCDVLRVITVDEDADTVGVYEINSTHLGSGCEWLYAPVGPYNLSHSLYAIQSGPTTMFGASVVAYYVAFLSANTTVAKTEQLYIELDTRCPPFENYKLLLCDKKGAWSGVFDFYYRSTEENIIKKQTYSKGGYGEVVGTSVVYNDRRRGFDPYNSEHIKSYTVRSDWMTQEEGDYLVECLMTPRAFWCQSATKFIPIVLDDLKVERLQEDQEDELLRYSVTFTKAYKEPSLN